MKSEQELLDELERTGWLLSDEEALEMQRLASHSDIKSLRGIDDRFDVLEDYRARGIAIVPQRPGEKKPRVKWKPFQSEAPTAADIYRWFKRWPDAGPAAVLGPVSNLFAVDVDGEQAHQELVRRLGDVPAAPMVLSGSGKRYRYHLFFECPPIPTKAKATPWHPNLEFRGQGGIVVLPPAQHKSGNKYKWASGRSLADIPLPPLPEAIVAALRDRKRPTNICSTIAREVNPRVRVVPGICRGTREFLTGRFAHSEGWNSRLFGAACDMAGNFVPLERALPLLIAAAKPWDSQEEAHAIATIQSAYSQPRTPAR